MSASEMTMDTKITLTPELKTLLVNAAKVTGLDQKELGQRAKSLMVTPEFQKVREVNNLTDDGKALAVALQKVVVTIAMQKHMDRQKTLFDVYVPTLPQVSLNRNNEPYLRVNCFVRRTDEGKWKYATIMVKEDQIEKFRLICGTPFQSSFSIGSSGTSEGLYTLFKTQRGEDDYEKIDDFLDVSKVQQEAVTNVPEVRVVDAKDHVGKLVRIKADPVIRSIPFGGQKDGAIYSLIDGSENEDFYKVSGDYFTCVHFDNAPKFAEGSQVYFVGLINAPDPKRMEKYVKMYVSEVIPWGLEIKPTFSELTPRNTTPRSKTPTLEEIDEKAAQGIADEL